MPVGVPPVCIKKFSYKIFLETEKIKEVCVGRWAVLQRFQTKRRKLAEGHVGEVLGGMLSWKEK